MGMNQKIIIMKCPSFYSPSRLLIPGYLLKFFKQKKSEFGNIKALFHYVVNHKFRVYNKKSMSREGRITYQPEGMEL